MSLDGGIIGSTGGSVGLEYGQVLAGEVRYNATRDGKEMATNKELRHGHSQKVIFSNIHWQMLWSHLWDVFQQMSGDLTATFKELSLKPFLRERHNL